MDMLGGMYFGIHGSYVGKILIITTASSGQVILSDKLWRLLADIICVPMDPNEPASGSTLGWLNGVVNRVPVLPIFATLLHTLGQTLPLTDAIPDGSWRLVLEAATDVAHVLLPLASSKVNCDAVANCFWEVYGVFSTRGIQEAGLLITLGLCETIASTFEASFASYSNKKKVSQGLDIP
jgi:hypothetical protein